MMYSVISPCKYPLEIDSNELIRIQIKASPNLTLSFLTNL